MALYMNIMPNLKKNNTECRKYISVITKSGLDETIVYTYMWQHHLHNGMAREINYTHKREDIEVKIIYLVYISICKV